MADLKQNMLRRLRSARQWLTRAEEAYGKDRDIRAELDLMLAEAELQHAKEARRPHRWKVSFISHSAALTAAMVITVAGLGGAYWWLNPGGHRMNVSAPLAAQDANRPTALAGQQAPPVHNESSVKPVAPAPDTAAQPVASVSHGEPKTPTAAAAPIREPNPPQMTENRIRDNEESKPAEKEVTLTPDEMQKLVRAAGKSLRGH